MPTPQQSDKLLIIYNTLKQRGYDVPDTYERFAHAFFSDNPKGASNRRGMYNALRALGYDVPANYDSYERTLWGNAQPQAIIPQQPQTQTVQPQTQTQSQGRGQSRGQGQRQGQGQTRQRQQQAQPQPKPQTQTQSQGRGQSRGQGQSLGQGQTRQRQQQAQPQPKPQTQTQLQGAAISGNPPVGTTTDAQRVATATTTPTSPQTTPIASNETGEQQAQQAQEQQGNSNGGVSEVQNRLYGITFRSSDNTADWTHDMQIFASKNPKNKALQLLVKIAKGGDPFKFRAAVEDLLKNTTDRAVLEELDAMGFYKADAEDIHNLLDFQDALRASLTPERRAELMGGDFVAPMDAITSSLSVNGGATAGFAERAAAQSQQQDFAIRRPDEVRQQERVHQAQVERSEQNRAKYAERTAEVYNTYRADGVHEITSEEADRLLHSNPLVVDPDILFLQSIPGVPGKRAGDKHPKAGFWGMLWSGIKGMGYGIASAIGDLSNDAAHQGSKSDASSAERLLTQLNSQGISIEKIYEAYKRDAYVQGGTSNFDTKKKFEDEMAVLIPDEKLRDILLDYILPLMLHNDISGNGQNIRTAIRNRAEETTWGDRQNEALKKYNDIRPEADGAGGKAGALIGGMLPVIPAFIASVISKNPGPLMTALEWGGLAAYGLSGETAQEFRKMGYSSSHALNAGLLSGALNTALMKIPFSRWSRSLQGRIQSGVGKGVKETLLGGGGDALEKEMESILIRGRRLYGEQFFSGATAKSIVKNMAHSAGSLTALGEIDPLIRLVYANPEDAPTAKEIFDNALNGVEDGMLLGAFFGTIGAARFSHANRSRHNKQGYVDIAAFRNADGELLVGELLGKTKEGKYQVGLGERVVEISQEDFERAYRYSLDEYRRGQVQYDTEDALTRGYTIIQPNGLPESYAARNQAYDGLRQHGIEHLFKDASDPMAVLLDMMMDEEHYTPSQLLAAQQYVRARAFAQGVEVRMEADIRERLKDYAFVDGMVRVVELTDGRGKAALLREEDGKYVVKRLEDGEVIMVSEKDFGNIVSRDLVADMMEEAREKARAMTEEQIEDADIEEVSQRPQLGYNQRQPQYDELQERAEERPTPTERDADASRATPIIDKGETYSVTIDGEPHDIEVVNMRDENSPVIDVRVDGGEVRPMVRAQLESLLAEDRNDSDATPHTQLVTDTQERTQADGTERAEGSELSEDVREVEEAQSNSERTERVQGEQGRAEDVQGDAMPMIGSGELADPDFGRVSPARAMRYVYDEAELSHDAANAFVTAKIDADRKALERAEKKEPKMGTSIPKYKHELAKREAKIADAKRELEYWQSVQLERSKIERAERQREEQERVEREAALHDAAVIQEQERQAEEIAKREEQAERGAHAVHPAIRERWNAAPKIEGAENEITLANGERVKGHYVLVESGVATPSHNPHREFTRNEGFPVDENGNMVNDRDYERDKDAQAITRQTASAYDSRAIQSVPVVSNDGVVLSGNGRTMAGELAARDNTDGAYIEHLRKYPQQFGFTPEQVEGMQHPRVLFVPDEPMPYTTETFAKFNAQDMKSQSRTELSVKLGKTVDDATFHQVINSINAFDTIGDFYNDPKATTAAIAALRDAGVINAMQYAEMFDGEKISGVGKQMLENMLIGKAFESNPDVIRQLSEIPSMRQSVISALAEIANNVGLGKEYSLESELADAINLVYQARKSGQYKAGEIVSSFARQLNLFPFDMGETVADYTNGAVLMLADVLNDGRVNLLKHTLSLYNRAAADSAEGQMDIFSGGVKSKQEIIKDVLNTLNYGTRLEQQAAIDAAREQRKAAAASEPSGGSESVSQDGTSSTVGGEGEDGQRLANGDRHSSEKGSLTEDEADDLILASAERAIPMQEFELTPENWKKEFGDGTLETPIEQIKIGKNQFSKMIDKGRKKEAGLIKPTFTDPDFVIEEASEATDGTTERASSHLYVKSFIGKDGKKRYFFKSVTIKRDGLEVNVSSHFDRPKRLREALKNGKLLYRFDGGAQTEQTPASVSVTTSRTNPGVSEGKGSEDSATAQDRLQKLREKHPESVLAEQREDGSVTFYGEDARRVGEMLGREVDGDELTLSHTEGDKALQKLVANGQSVVFYGEYYKPTAQQALAAPIGSEENLAEHYPRYHKLSEEERGRVRNVRDMAESLREAEDEESRLAKELQDRVEESIEREEAGEVTSEAEKRNTNELSRQHELAKEDSRKKSAALYNALRDLSDEELAGLDDLQEAVKHDGLGLHERVEYEQRRRAEAKRMQAVQDERFERAKAEQDVRPVAGKPRALKADDFASKEAFRPAMNGVYHDERGFGVVSDGHVLITSKKLYDKKHKGKTVLTHKVGDKAKGSVIQGSYPDWTTNADLLGDKRIPVNFDELGAFVNGIDEMLKAEWKAKKSSGEKVGTYEKWSSDTYVHLRMPDGTIVSFRLKNLRLFVEGAKHLEARSIAWEEAGRSISARSDNGVVLAISMYADAQYPMDAREFAYDFKGGDNAPAYHKAEKHGDVSAREAELRDAVVDVLRGAGIDVSVDEEEGQRVLDVDNERRARLMGTTTRKRQKSIGAVFDGKKLSVEQRTIVDVFSGEADNESVTLTDKNGNQRNITFRQGNDNKAGAKHSVFRHCNTEKDGYTPEEVAMIPDIVAKGERKQDGGRVAYRYTDNDVTYTVTTEYRMSGEEFFTNFFTNRKPIAVENGTSNTAKRHVPQQSVSGAKLQKVSEPSKDSPVFYSNAENVSLSGLNGQSSLSMHDVDVTPAMKASVMEGQPMFFRTSDGQAYGYTLNGKIYIDPRIATAETSVHEYHHLWSDALERANPEAWAHLKEQLFKDADLRAFVEGLYPELANDENALAHEMFSHFGGKRGAERLRAEHQRMEAENKDGVFGKARIIAMFDKLRSMIAKYWQMARDLFAGNNARLGGMSAEDFADMAMADLMNGVKPRGERSGRSITEEQRALQEKEVQNVVVRTTDVELPKNVHDAVEVVKGMKRPFINDDQQKEIVVSNNAVKHSSIQDHDRSDVRCMGVIDRIIKNAVKIGNLPVAKDELGHTHAVEVYYCPVNIDSVQYSARLLVKQYENRGMVLDDFRLYDLSAKQEKTDASSVVRGENTLTPTSAPVSGYKVRELIHSSQVNDQKLLGIDGNGGLFHRSDKTLMGVHNISEEKLRKAIQQGGMANPSIAVIDTQNDMHSDFGEISLIPRSKLIDSKTGRNAGTFAGDAWTATYPQVEKQMSDKGREAFHAEVDAVSEHRGLRGALKMSWESYLEGRDPDKLAYWFLVERGIEPEQVVFESGYSEEQRRRFAELTDNGKKRFTEMSAEERSGVLALLAESKGISSEELLEKYQDMRRRNEELLEKGEVTGFRKSRLEDQNAMIDKYGITLSPVSDFLYGMKRALESDGQLDVDGTLAKARERMRHEGMEADFRSWLEGKEQAYGVQEMLFDGFTEDGERKYVPNTLENASEMMNREALANADGRTGLGPTRALLLGKMDSLEEIRRQKGKLQGVDADTEERYEAASNEMFNVVNALSDMQEISGNPFLNVDYANARLQEALSKKDPIGWLNKEYGYEIDRNDEFARGLQAMIQTLEDLPVKYFETKFRRPVTLDEFAVAIVPESTSEDVVKSLHDAGLDVRTYDGTEEERRGVTMDAVQGRGDIMFQKVGEPSEGEEVDARDTSTLSVKEMSEREADREYLRLADILEKPARIEKLRQSSPVEIMGDEVASSDDISVYRRNAMEYGKTLQGVYTNADTGAKIEVVGNSIKEVLHHDYKDVPHLQSVAAIPSLIEKGVFISSEKNEGNKDIDHFDYYVCGLKIAGEDYTVKYVISNKSNGERYYDHKLTQIEKGKLLDLSAVSSAESASSSQLSAYKDKRLFSILQVNEAEIAKSEQRMREILDEMKRRRGYTNDSEYQGSLAFNGAAPSRNVYFWTKEARKQAFEDGDFEGEYSLGDFMDNGIDGNDLEWQIENPRIASKGDRATGESISNLRSVVKEGRRTIKMYRAVDADIKEGAFRNGDWITPSKRYAEQHIGLQSWKSGRVIEQEVSVDDIWWDGNDINEWGFDDGKEYAYRNTKNNLKSDDLVTRDDNGQVILPSQRFDAERDDVRYRLREDAPPTKTGVGYKVFVLKDGKLYPPMVANPNGEATPFGVWLDADAAPIVGTTKTGRQQIKSGGKGTQGGSGKLAYRPGWHLGEIPYALQFNRVNPETGQRELFPANFVWAEVEYANDVDYQQEAMSYGINARGKFQHSLAGLPRLPENGSYKYRTNPDPNTEPWIITGAMKVKRILKPSEVDAMVENAGYEPQDKQVGAITDEQVERLNTELAHTMEQDAGMMRKTAEQMGARLNTPIRIIEDVNDITHPNPKIQARRRGAKGWYDRETEEVVVVLPNHESVEDVAATVGHEVVGHKGLREMIGEERYNEFLDEVYSHLRDNLKEEVDEATERAFAKDKNKSKEQHRREQVDELLARMAEKLSAGFSKGERIWWQKVKAIARKILDKFLGTLKLPKWFKLGDNELAYMLWRSKERLQRGKEHPIDLARDIVKRKELGLDDAVYMMGDSPETFKARQKRAVENRGTVMPRLNEAQVKVIDVPRHSFTGTGKQAIEKARIWANDNLVGSHTAHQIGNEFEYSIDEEAVKKFLSSSSTLNSDNLGVHLAVLTELLNVIDSSIEVEEHPDYKKVNGERKMENGVNDTNLLVHRMYGAVKIDDKIYRVKTTMHEHYEKGNAPHDYRVTKVELLISGSATSNALSNSTGVGTPNSELEAYPLAKLLQNVEKAYDKGKKILDESKTEDTYLYRDVEDDNNLDDDFVEAAEGYKGSNGILGYGATLTDALVKLSRENKNNLQHKKDAMRAIGGDLSKLRSAVARQREYDKGTVDAIVKLAQTMISSGLFHHLSPYEVKRLMGMVNRAVGREDITKQAGEVVDMLLKHQIKEYANFFNELLRIKSTKINNRGVEVAGRLDIEGQRMLSELKEGIKLDEEALSTRIEECLDRMGSADSVTAKNASVAYQGLLLAQRFIEDVKRSEAEESGLQKALREAKEDKAAGMISRESYNEFVRETKDAISTNRIERIEAYKKISEDFYDSIVRGQQWRISEIERANEIHHFANSDLQGISANEHNKQSSFLDRSVNWDGVRIFMQPMATFNEMLRFFGSKSTDGKGYLWNYFMESFHTSWDNEWRGVREAFKELDDKVSEIFGKKMQWSDLHDIERKLSAMHVYFLDADGMSAHKLSQGNLLYIYMVNKMVDGRMKLRKMGITQERVDAIRANLDPRLVELADWLQEEFLVQKREKYNEVYERLYGAPMAAIDDYFPLKINHRSLNVKEEVVNQTNNTGVTPIPGSIIKRTRNASPLDLMGANAFDVVVEHIRQMESFAALGEFQRDLKTLLSYKRFRNKVQNMCSIRFGAGETLWNNFKDVCAIAAGTYRPAVKRDHVDALAVNIAKGVTAAKIAFNTSTAFKQLLSYPAYFSEASVLELAKSSNPIGAVRAWNWAIEELPGFARRWQSRFAGDTRLAETEADWAVWRTKLAQTAMRWGMASNALVDAITVAMGAKAIYESSLKRYKSIGYNAERAKKKALLDAASYNETQQSSEGAYVSSMQLDRTALSVSLSVYRNASMGYERKLLRSIKGALSNLNPKYKSKCIEFMQKQMEREGLTSDQAQRAARRTYWRSWYKHFFNIALFGFTLQAFWNLGSYMWHLALGNDDDLKKDMLSDSFLHAILGGSFEGLTGGNIISELIHIISNGGKLQSVDTELLPFLKDLKSAISNFDRDQISAMNDVFSLLIQSGLNVNPQILADVYAAIWDYSNNDPTSAREITLLILRTLQVPQNQLDNLYLDGLNLKGSEAQELTATEMAQRYAKYKSFRNAPLLHFRYDEAALDKIEERYISRFTDRIAERLENFTDEELERLYNRGDDELLRRLVGKQVAKRQGNGIQDPYASPRNEYGERYLALRNYNDLAEDILLQSSEHSAREAGQTARADSIKAARGRITALKKGYHYKGKNPKNRKRNDELGLGEGNSQSDSTIMQRIREQRANEIKKLGL